MCLWIFPFSRTYRGGESYRGGKGGTPSGTVKHVLKNIVFCFFPPKLVYFVERLCAAIVSLPPPVLEVPRRAGQGSWRPGCPPDRQDRWPGNPSLPGKQQMSAISSSLSTLAGLVLPEPHSVEWGTASTLFRGIGYSRYPTPWNRAPKVLYSVLLSKSIFYSTHRQVPSNSVKMKKHGKTLPK